MELFCQDADLLRIEPRVFLDGGPCAQALETGADGQIAGATFTSAGSDFAATGVAAGMALRTDAPGDPEGRAVEIVSVDSPTALTVSLSRASADDDPVPPPAGTGLSFRVLTCRAQTADVSRELADRLRRAVEAAGVSRADFADAPQLAAACAHGVLAAVFTAAAENASEADARWLKAEHYRDEYRRRQLRLRLAVDVDADGFAERSRTLGHVVLRRV